MKTRNIIPVLLLLAALPVGAQKLKVQESTVNVGRTGYQQPVTAVFEFKNKGGRKLRITSVKPDCQCTKVDYPKGELTDKFQIRMTYDARQLGHFDKQAAIYTSGDEKPLYICMKGVVLADVLDFTGSYPVKMGDLLLDKADLEFDDVNRGFQQVQQLHIYNNGEQVYHPNLMHLPAYLSATMRPERLAPGRAGTMTVTLHSDKLRDYGLTQTSVFLAAKPGDRVNRDHEISVSAVLLPPFVNLTEEQKLNAPKIALSQEQVDISFEGKTKKKAVIEITNHGRTRLDISSLQLFTRGLRVSLSKSRLQPGESTKLKITALRDDLKKVRTRPRILMITNDPDKPKVTITINAQ